MNPKPFHIGTRIIGAEDAQCIDGKSPEVRVAWSMHGYLYTEMFDPFSGRWIFVIDFTEVEKWRHADDGSPLGEWEPIKPHPADVFVDGEVIDDYRERINRIIRGEEEQ